MNKEQVYDETIAPLMAQIIETCQKHGIAMIASFAIPTEDDPTLRCTSHLMDGEGTAVFERAYGVLIAKRSPTVPPMMLTVRDADGNVKSMTAIVG